MEKYVEQLQNRGFDGSGPVYKSQGPASGASSPSSGADVGNTDGIATNDGVSLPKLYEYDITLPFINLCNINKYKTIYKRTHYQLNLTIKNMVLHCNHIITPNSTFSFSF